MRVTDTDLPVVVEPVGARNQRDLAQPVEAKTIIYPAIMVEPVEAQTLIDPPIVVEPVEAKTIIDLPIVVEPVEAKTVIDSPIVAQLIKKQSITDIHDDTENKNQICLINYGAEFQGLVITNQEIECHYYDIHTALFNTFISDSYAIVILEGYMMALVKQIIFMCLTHMPETLLACLIVMALLLS